AWWLFIVGFEGETGRARVCVGVRRREQRMDYALRESGARKDHVANRSTRAAAIVEGSHGVFVPGDEVGLWTIEQKRISTRRTALLQRLPEFDFYFWLARAAHDSVRSSACTHVFLHFSSRL